MQRNTKYAQTLVHISLYGTVLLEFQKEASVLFVAGHSLDLMTLGLIKCALFFLSSAHLLIFPQPRSQSQKVSERKNQA